jgi:alkylation response protein AidB-like acyl-CoA dehydrogenase
VVDGVKAWVTHGGEADFYNLMVRTGVEGAKGISCLLAPAATPGLLPQAPERKMGMRSSPTASIVLEQARVPRGPAAGRRGQGFRIAMAALDGGRLGISACAVGLAQAALDAAVDYAKERSSSASGSPTSRACRSCWPTWRRRSRRRALSTCRPPRLKDAAGRSALRRR